MAITYPVGGIQTWCKYYYRHPRFRQFDIEIIAPMSEECLHLQKSMEPLGIPVRVTASAIRNFAWETWRSIVNGRWDLVHAHGFTAGDICAPVARLFEVPCLVTQHDVILDSQYNDFKRQAHPGGDPHLACAGHAHSLGVGKRGGQPGGRGPR